jgi:hypothetical protein
LELNRQPNLYQCRLKKTGNLGYKIEDDTWPLLTKLLCHSKDRQIKEEAMLRQAALRMETELKKTQEGNW